MKTVRPYTSVDVICDAPGCDNRMTRFACDYRAFATHYCSRKCRNRGMRALNAARQSVKKPEQVP